MGFCQVKIFLVHLPSGYDYITVCHGIDGPNRNGWFTVLNSMVDLSMAKLLHNQRLDGTSKDQR